MVVRWLTPSLRGGSLLNHQLEVKSGAKYEVVGVPDGISASQMIITGLTPGTTYEMRMKFENEGGWSEYSQPALVSTAADLSTGCPAGQELIGNACKDCMVGNFKAASGPGRCSPCAPGTVQPGVGSTSCIECSPGTSQVSAGMAQCVSCSPGYHMPDFGAETCSQCPPGTFMPEFAALSCRLCQPLQHQRIPASLSCEACPPNTNSTPGSATCSMCAVRTHRVSTAVLASEATCAPCPEHVECPVNTTVATFNLDDGYWRHSITTSQFWRCTSSGDWNPCRGGVDTGAASTRYCKDGYSGPRCELCSMNGTDEYARYFDRIDARCHDCGDVTAHAATLFCVLLFLLLAYDFGHALTLPRRIGQSRGARDLLKAFRTIQRLWGQVGMQCKIKLLIGLWQCLAAATEVFDVIIPPDLEHYATWVRIIELPADFGVNIFVPAACFGSYRRRLLIYSIWPAALLLIVAMIHIGWEIALTARRTRGALQIRPAIRTIVGIGLHRTVHFILVLTFCLVPSTATQIFKTFLCDRFEHVAAATVEASPNATVAARQRSEPIYRRYLHDGALARVDQFAASNLNPRACRSSKGETLAVADLRLDCDSTEYAETKNIAQIMIVVWPIGTPLMYLLLLWMNRHAIRTGKPTPMRRAISFLSDDYTKNAFWWEPLEMCRKLAVTGLHTTLFSMAAMSFAFVLFA